MFCLRLCLKIHFLDNFFSEFSEIYYHLTSHWLLDFTNLLDLLIKLLINKSDKMAMKYFEVKMMSFFEIKMMSNVRLEHNTNNTI